MKQDPQPQSQQWQKEQQHQQDEQQQPEQQLVCYQIQPICIRPSKSILTNTGVPKPNFVPIVR